MTRPDVTIIGAGIFGLTTAWALAQRGAKVQVLEKGEVGAGASGGVVGALSPHAPEKWNPMKEFQFRSLIRASTFWAEVEAAGGVPSGFARTGRIQAIENETGLNLAHERAEAARELWRGQAQWAVTNGGGHALRPTSPTGLYIEDTLSARIAPRAATAALRAALRAKGAEVIPHCDTTRYAPRAGEKVVHASGVAGLLEISKIYDRKLGSGVKGQGALLKFDARYAPQIYAPGLHIIPHFDGTIAVGSTSENHYQHEDVDAQVHDLLAKARAALPALQNAPVLELWAGIRPRAITRAPVIGPWPDRPGHFIANGGFKTGFGMAPRAAELLADHLLEIEDQIPPALLPQAMLAL